MFHSDSGRRVVELMNAVTDNGSYRVGPEEHKYFIIYIFKGGLQRFPYRELISDT